MMKPSDIDVLIVDDDAHVLAALRRELMRGWAASGGQARVRTFTSGACALDALRGEPADVVVSDYRMPGMDGVELLCLIRDLQPATGRILMSGSTDFSFLLKAVNQAAVERVLLKPWFDGELVDAVRQSIRCRRLLLENTKLTEQLAARWRGLLLENVELEDQLREHKGLLSEREAALRRFNGLDGRSPEVNALDPCPEAPLTHASSADQSPANPLAKAPHA